MKKDLRVGYFKTRLLLGLLTVASVAVLSGQALAATCSTCHTMPPTDAATRDAATGGFVGNHQTHLPATAVAADCVKCHKNTSKANGDPVLYTTGHAATNNYEIRMSASIGGGTYGRGQFFNMTSMPPVSTCSTVNCHFESITPTWGSAPASTNCSTCHATPRGNSGSHNAHEVKYGGTSSCVQCHPNTTTYSHATSAGKRSIALLGTLGYTGTADKYLPSQQASAVYGTCATYCHSYGTTTTAPFTAKSAATWGGSPVNCYSCHGSDSTTGLFKNMSTGRHKKHMVGQYTYGCVVCHSTTVSSNTQISDQSKHVNTQIDVSFSGLAKSGGANAIYTNSGHAPGQPGTVNDSCQNVYCHSNAQIGGQAGTQLRFRNLTGNKRFSQTITVSLGCNGCHSTGSTTTGPMILSGKHLAHVVATTEIGKALACNDCHLTGGTNLNRANHANGFVNYSGLRAGGQARLNYATGVCSNVYCHSDGRGNYKSMATDNWFSATNLNCTGCHGGVGSVAGEPVYTTGNSHVKHVGTVNASSTCQNCHRKTTSGAFLNASSYHTNGTFEVLAGNGKTFNWTQAGTSCSSISCHSGGSAVWGGALDCAGCHATLSGAHGKHMGKISLPAISGLTNKFDNFTANRSTGNDATITYGFGCANCHPVAESVSHINGTVDVQLAPVAGAGTLRNRNTNGTNNGVYNGDKSCDVVYCHGDGKNPLVVGANGKAPIWTAAFANADRCANCHGNNPTTSAHSAHVVGIHYDDVFSGTSGKLPKADKASNATNAAHGYGRATTINCNICHSATVTSPNNDKATTCSTATSCHGAGGVTKGDAAIALMQNHVNGKVDVQFANINIKTKAQVRTISFSGYTAAGWTRTSYKNYTSSYDVSKNKLFVTASFTQATGTCDNVVCHNNQQVKWIPAQAITCDNCHGRL